MVTQSRSQLSKIGSWLHNKQVQLESQLATTIFSISADRSGRSSPVPNVQDINSVDVGHEDFPNSLRVDDEFKHSSGSNENTQDELYEQKSSLDMSTDTSTSSRRSSESESKGKRRLRGLRSLRKKGSKCPKNSTPSELRHPTEPTTTHVVAPSASVTTTSSHQVPEFPDLPFVAEEPRALVHERSAVEQNSLLDAASYTVATSSDLPSAFDRPCHQTPVVSVL